MLILTVEPCISLGGLVYVQFTRVALLTLSVQNGRAQVLDIWLHVCTAEETEMRFYPSFYTVFGHIPQIYLVTLWKGLIPTLETTHT